MISTFRSFSGGPVPASYTVVFMLHPDRGLVLGDARVEVERELAEGKKHVFGALFRVPQG